jgi:hypothetical protein
MDGQLLGLNLVVMFGIVLIPFTTEALGKLDLPLPVAVYALDIALTYIVLNAVELIADRRGLRPTRMTTPELRSHLAISAVLPVIFLASIPVAYLVNPKVAQWSWVLIAVLIPVVRAGSPDRAPPLRPPTVHRRRRRIPSDRHRSSGHRHATAPRFAPADHRCRPADRGARRRRTASPAAVSR